MKILVEMTLSDKKSIEWFKELAWNTDNRTFFYLNFLSGLAVDIWIDSNVGDLRYLERVLGVGYPSNLNFGMFKQDVGRISEFCRNMEVVGNANISTAINEENFSFFSGKRYMLCTKDSSAGVDELIKDFGNKILEKEIGICVDFEKLKDEKGRIININQYGLSILPYVSMVRFSQVSSHSGIPKWFMTDVLKFGKSVKWLLITGKWILNRQADKYPMLSELAMSTYQDLRYVEEKMSVKKRSYTWK